MAVTPTDREVRDAIAAKLKSVLWLEVTGNRTADNQPKIYPYNPLKPMSWADKDKSKILEQWVGFSNYAHIEDPLTNVVTLKTLGAFIKRKARMADLRGGGCEDRLYPYDVWILMGFDDPVTEADVTTYSEDVFNSQVIDPVAEVFNVGSSAGEIWVGDVQLLHEGLQFPVLSMFRAGEQVIHFGAGEIELSIRI